MCLGIPAKVIEVRKGELVVEYMGIRRVVDDLIFNVKPGDYVIVHAGAAIGKIDPKEAMEILNLWKEMISIVKYKSESKGV